jgi:hypothetical protein
VTVRKLEKGADNLAQALIKAETEIQQLNEIVAKDNTQREVDSKR